MKNKYKNPIAKDLGDLESFLQLIADLDEEIELFAIGGTAMVLKKIKESTKDIDFLVTTDHNKIKRLFNLAGLKEEESSQACNIWRMNNIRIDIFYVQSIMGITLPDDWKSLSEQVRDIGKVRLFILNWYDIIITKIARSEPRDVDDIKAIIAKQDIDIKKLKERYYSIAETAIIADYDYKFRHMEKNL